MKSLSLFVSVCAFSVSLFANGIPGYQNNIPAGEYAQEESIVRYFPGEDVLSVRVIQEYGVKSSLKRVKVEYQGNVTPPSTYSYSYTENGTRYTVLLQLESVRYVHSTNMTIAIYSGRVD